MSKEKDAAAMRHNVDAFLSDLTELSRRHLFAIGDGGEIYEMERDDMARRYTLVDDDVLDFG